MKNFKYELESTDYDVNQIENLDYRLEAGKKDAFVFHGLGITAGIIATIWMYYFGSTAPENMKYLFGMPLWISGAILIYLIMFIMGMLYIFKWEEFPLVSRINHKKDKENKI